MREDGLVSDLNYMSCDMDMNVEPEGAHTTPPEILVVIESDSLG